MVLFANLLILVGALGFLQSTLGSSLIAWMISRITVAVKGPKGMLREINQNPIRIDILVAAHNEEKSILQTLTSLDHAREVFALKNRRIDGASDGRHEPRVRIHLGVDHCTDQTEEVAKNWSKLQRKEIRITRNTSAQGKWNMLQSLVRTSDADWVALVDVGSVWEAGLLGAAQAHFADPEVMGIAPSYRPANAGLAEKMTWRLERFLKTVESEAGGPVSVHGATVMYRRELLLKAFEKLSETASEQVWLNDDVVLPLTLRMEFPEHRIVYLSKAGNEAWVRDYGIRSAEKIEYGRRKRMLIGNLQWIRSLYFKSFISNLNVGLIASRRVFRTFWAYWILAIVVGVVLRLVIDLHPSAGALSLSAIAACAISAIPLKGGLGRIRTAFIACLELPFHRFQSQSTRPEKIWN